MGAVALYDDGWAIRALPPGRRDLGCFELWERSLERSRRRRAMAERRTALPARAVAAALLAATVVVPAADLASAQDTAGVATADLKRGSRGPAVAAAQRALGIPADGIFGRQTSRAVRAFQAAHGLEVDGVIGPVTRGALGSGGSSGGAQSVTMTLQRALGVAADGEYGPITRAAVRRYQQAHGLSADGVAGPQTLGSLGLPTNVTLGEDTSSSSAGAVLAAVRAQVGKPYEWAGNGPASFDCSGLTVWAFRSVGISLPRTTYGQVGMGAPVDRSSIQPGDLVFWDTDGSGASHVGIATSATTAISATASSGVIEHTITGSYWGRRYVTARRLG
ncbi:MAG TPA: peptidoglycan-binding protein [Solirubrobacteraceae bacterium]|nr:peptidoglycan-binding protein [Solirubrobacteraceae bacterium]